MRESMRHGFSNGTIILNISISVRMAEKGKKIYHYKFKKDGQLIECDENLMSHAT